MGLKGNFEDPSKDIIGASRRALRILTDTCIFRLTRLEIHNENFGNVVAVLTTEVGIEVDFIRDRWDGYCQVVVGGLPVQDPERPDIGRTFMLRHVMDALGAEVPPSFMGMANRDKGYVDLIKETSKNILKHWALLVRAFDEEHRLTTVKTITKHERESSIEFMLRPLTEDKSFKIAEIRYDEANSRVDLVRLRSATDIAVILAYGGPVASCRIGIWDEEGTILPLDDVLESVGAKPIGSERSTIGTISRFAALAIKENWPALSQALNSEHRDNTIARIRNTRKDRADR